MVIIKLICKFFFLKVLCNAWETLQSTFLWISKAAVFFFKIDVAYLETNVLSCLSSVYVHHYLDLLFLQAESESRVCKAAGWTREKRWLLYMPCAFRNIAKHLPSKDLHSHNELPAYWMSCLVDLFRAQRLGATSDWSHKAFKGQMSGS